MARTSSSTVVDRCGDVVTGLRLLGANSAIYTATNFLQKGTALLLMPLYTLYLDPEAYGVLAIVTALNGFLSLAFTLNLMGAVTRFYFEYRDEPETLAEFWGTILCFVLLLSLVLGVIILLTGRWLLSPLIGNVAFYPYVALGVITAIFQPFFTTFLVVLQTRNEGGKYALMSLAHFALTTLLTVALVVMLGWGAVGALVAILTATIVFFAVSLWMLRSNLRLCLRWHHLRPALAYSFPQVPHLLSTQTTAIADRLILNSKLGASAAGLYSVGAMISMAVEVAAQSVNRAYVPIGMSALKSRDPAALHNILVMGSLVVALFCMVGATVASFANEIITLATAPEFHRAAAVVPLLVFGRVAGAIYYLLVNVLFFDRDAVKLLPIGSIAGAILNVVIALALIPPFGLMGAALASLVAQILATVLIGAIARRFDPVRWPYWRFAMAFGASLLVGLLLANLQVGGMFATIGWKIVGLALLAPALGLILWLRPLILFEAALLVSRRQFASAGALFRNERL
jgi:O-antigen/teichoic acid export membrane protein